MKYFFRLFLGIFLLSCLSFSRIDLLSAGQIEHAPSAQALEDLEAYLEIPRSSREPLSEQSFARVPLTKEAASKAVELLWNDHVRYIKKDRAEEMQSNRLTLGDKAMPFFYRVFGDKPEEGRSLYISLHGGGGTRKEVNDRQWENQKRLYRIEEGVYLAPRAPTDTWDLWHRPHIDTMLDRLIENLIVFEEVDPNRVYLLGYSAGGDGVYQLAPRMADRWAAAAMMAGHPNDASPLGLRNVPFTIHVGGNDAAYRRNEVAREWGEHLDRLHEEDPEGYLHWTKVYEGKGHWLDREDAAALDWMARHRRHPLPERILWRQDEVTHARFYWLAVEPNQASKGQQVDARKEEQVFDLEAKGIDRVILRLNDRMVDMDQEIVVLSGKVELFRGRIDRSIGVIARTLAERGDPSSVFRGEVTVDIPEG